MQSSAQPWGPVPYPIEDDTDGVPVKRTRPRTQALTTAGVFPVALMLTTNRTR